MTCEIITSQRQQSGLESDGYSPAGVSACRASGSDHYGGPGYGITLPPAPWKGLIFLFASLFWGLLLSGLFGRLVVVGAQAGAKAEAQSAPQPAAGRVHRPPRAGGCAAGPDRLFPGAGRRAWPGAGSLHLDRRADPQRQTLPDAFQSRQAGFTPRRSEWTRRLGAGDPAGWT